MKDRIFDIGYRTLPPDEHRRRPVWPIARTAIVLAWRQRSTKLAALLCGSVFLGFGIWLVARSVFERLEGGKLVGPAAAAHLLGSAQEAISAYLSTQFFTTALAMSVISAGLVAEDRRAGAFDLYFARPLTRLDYAAGKLLAAALVPLATLVVPVFVMWLTAVGIAPPALRGNLWSLALPALTGALLAAAVLTSTMVGLSAVGLRARTVGVSYVGALLVISALSGGLPEAGQTWAGYFGPERDLRTVVDALLNVGVESVVAQLVPRRSVPTNPDATASVVGLFGYIAAGVGTLAWRLRREVQT